MKLSTAIQSQDLTAVEKAVVKAVQAHKENGKKAVDAETPFTMNGTPEEANVETVYGAIPFSMIFDEDTKWATITAAYVSVAQTVKALPKTFTTEEVNAATVRLISENRVLRSLSGANSTTNDYL